MSKKVTKLLGIIFAGVALLSLFAPLYRTTFTDGEAWTLTLYGYDLYEFSVWGVVTAIVPILLIGIMFINFNHKIKAIATMGLFVFGSISMQLSNSAMRSWIYGEANNIVYHFNGQIFYTSLLLCASFLCFVSCVMKNTDFEEAYLTEFRDYLMSEKISIETDSIFDKEFLLFNKPCKMIKNNKSAMVTEEDAHVIFGTHDGYFITDVQDDSRNIDFYIGKNDLYGFSLKNTNAGIVGIHTNSHDLTQHEKIRISPESEISTGEAELYYNRKRTKINLTVKDDTIFEITGTICDNNFDITEIRSGVIIQNGKLAAVATNYDGKINAIVCESAEKYATELNTTICEQKLFRAIRGFEDYLQRK